MSRPKNPPKVVPVAKVFEEVIAKYNHPKLWKGMRDYNKTETSVDFTTDTKHNSTVKIVFAVRPTHVVGNIFNKNTGTLLQTHKLGKSKDVADFVKHAANVFCG